MSIVNTFPVFDADQVLTNKHLNDLFNYLDQQDRLSRCKLIGSGIVCGLDISSSPGAITISKGCGLTSQGYILLLCQSVYTYCIPFVPPALPDDITFITQCDQNIDRNNILFYQATGQTVHSKTDNGILELITDAAFQSLSDADRNAAIALTQINLSRYLVVLFLDAEEIKLKNCDTNDCNDKGSRMDLEVRALLVDKRRFRGIDDTGKGGKPDATLLHHAELRRYNVPVKPLRSSDDVLNAFVSLVDNATLDRLANDMQYCFEEYGYLLQGLVNSPFNTLAADLRNWRDLIIKKDPILIQYFYDFIYDLIKAFYELRYKARQLTSECCGNEMKFPFHLVLGQADANTAGDGQSPYRQYFIYSPLFSGENEGLSEVRSLFVRMVLMVKEFLLTEKALEKGLPGQIRVTPSRYGHAFLSERCIPYYYKVVDTPDALYTYWNYEKTKRGNASWNLGYNAALYSAADPVVHPLVYDIEAFDFFRIEGHIGKPVTTAISNVKAIQQKYNLPFDIIALSADYIGALLKGTQPQCVVQDLESDYRVLLAEFVCELHDAFCFAAKITFDEKAFSGASTPQAEEAAFLFHGITVGAGTVDHPFTASLVNEFQSTKSYQKAATLSRLCAPAKNTIGDYYGTLVSNGQAFVNPAPINSSAPLSLLYHHLFEYIDSVESIFVSLMPNDLSSLNIADVQMAYNRLIKEVNAVNGVLIAVLKSPEAANIQILLHTCILEKLEALKTEYLRRTAQYRLAMNFYYYFSHHGGIEHKAGVPRGGTFILVYHEEKGGRFIDMNAAFVNKELGSLLLSRFRDLLQQAVTLDEMELKTQTLQTALLYQDPALYLQYKDLMKEYLDACTNLPPDKKKTIQTIIDQPPAVTRYRLPNGTVIADFYIPYCCCTDCAPVAYILPMPAESQTPAPEITIDGKRFCNNDANPANNKIHVQPAEAEVTGDGVHIAPDGSLVFIPSGLAAGLHTITATLNDKQASLQVEVLAAPVAGFDTSNVSFDANGNPEVSFTNTSQGATSWSWDFGDGQTSTDANPKHIYANNPASAASTVTVSLTAKNDVCSDIIRRTVDLQQPVERKTMTVCSNVKALKLEPNLSATDVVKVLTNDGNIKLDAAKLVVSPSATKATQTTVYQISYTVNNRQIDLSLTLVVANANFTMQIGKDPANPAAASPVLILKAVQPDADVYSWDISQQNQERSVNLHFTDKEVHLSYPNNGLIVESNLDINLTVTYNIPTGNAGETIPCGDKKNYVLTPPIFRHHFDLKDVFTNTTPS